MFRLANIFLFFALVTSVFGATVFKPKQCGKYAVVQNVKLLKTQFRQPKAVCNWYLSKKRTFSPNRLFMLGQFTKACECLAQKKASTQIATAKAPYNFSKTCKPAQKVKLIANFVNPKFPNKKGSPKAWCDFWGKGDKVFRVVSPFMDMSAQQVYNACECYYNPITTTSSTSTTTTMSTTTSASTSTTTSVRSSSSSSSSSTSTGPVVTSVPTPVIPIPTSTSTSTTTTTRATTTPAITSAPTTVATTTTTGATTTTTGS